MSIGVTAPPDPIVNVAWIRTPRAGATGCGEKVRRRARLRGTSGGRVVLVVSEAEPSVAGEVELVGVRAVVLVGVLAGEDEDDAVEDVEL